MPRRSFDRQAMKPSGKPDAGNPPVRFDEGDGRAQADRPYSPDHDLHQLDDIVSDAQSPASLCSQ